MPWKKNTYRILTIGLLTIALLLLGNYFQFEIKWYFYLILIFIGNIIGNFLFVYFSGINISDLEYLDNTDDLQTFKCEYQLGFSDIRTVIGVFQNKFGLEEPDLRNIIYLQTDRKDIKALEFTDEKQVIYSYKNHQFPILYKN